MPPETPQINPYGAPLAPVGDYIAGDRGVLDRARSVPPDHGVAWYREAWRLFRVSPGLWIGIWVAYIAILYLIGRLPSSIGGLVIAVVTPLLAGGALTAARRADREGVVRFADLFSAFTGPAGTLLLIGLAQLLLSFILGVVVALGAGVYFDSMVTEQPSFDRWFSPAFLFPFVILAFVISLIFLPVTNAVWLASGLAAMDGVSALEALRRGFDATFRNLLPLLVFGLVTVALVVVALIPIGLGLLVLGPVLLCAIYAQYKDLFETTEANP